MGLQSDYGIRRSKLANFFKNFHLRPSGHWKTVRRVSRGASSSGWRLGSRASRGFFGPWGPSSGSRGTKGATSSSSPSQKGPQPSPFGGRFAVVPALSAPSSPPGPTPWGQIPNPGARRRGAAPFGASSSPPEVGEPRAPNSHIYDWGLKHLGGGLLAPI